MNRWCVPGIALAIYQDGDVDARGYGVSSLETEYPMTPDTLLQIGSISKIFTTTLAMKLVDQGLLDLDSPVSRYFPAFRLTKSATQDKVRIRDLFTHTSGVYGDHFEDFGWGDDALEQYVESMSDLDQVYEPGTIWSYTNSGFNLAGRIIEIALDMPFEDAVAEHIFKPLGMEHSFYFPHDAITYPVSVGHTLVEPGGTEHQVARRWPIPRASGPAGSISSTVHDMLKFARYHMGEAPENGDPILSEFSRKLMQDVQVKHAGLADSWGLGWHINNFDGTQAIGHGGSTNGFQAHLDLIPDKGWAMITLTNSGQGAAAYRAITNWAFKEYCGLSRPEPEHQDLSQEALTEYAGNYSRPAVDVTISVDGDGLKLEAVSHSLLADTDEDRKIPPVKLDPVGNDRFYIREGASAGSPTDFIRYPDGAIRFVRFGGRVIARDK